MANRDAKISLGIMGLLELPNVENSQEAVTWQQGGDRISINRISGMSGGVAARATVPFLRLTEPRLMRVSRTGSVPNDRKPLTRAHRTPPVSYDSTDLLVCEPGRRPARFGQHWLGFQRKDLWGVEHVVSIQANLHRIGTCVDPFVRNVAADFMPLFCLKICPSAQGRCR